MLKTKCSLALAMIVALLSIATTPVAGAARAVANREDVQARNLFNLSRLDLRGVVSSITTNACITHPCAKPASISSDPIHAAITEHPKPSSSSDEGVLNYLSGYSYGYASVSTSFTNQSMSSKTKGIVSSSYDGYSYDSISNSASVTTHLLSSQTHSIHNPSSPKLLPPSTSSDVDGFVNSILTLKPSTATSTILFTVTPSTPTTQSIVPPKATPSHVFTSQPASSESTSIIMVSMTIIPMPPSSASSESTSYTTTNITITRPSTHFSTVILRSSTSVSPFAYSNSVVYFSAPETSTTESTTTRTTTIHHTIYETLTSDTMSSYGGSPQSVDSKNDNTNSGTSTIIGGKSTTTQAIAINPTFGVSSTVSAENAYTKTKAACNYTPVTVTITAVFITTTVAGNVPTSIVPNSVIIASNINEDNQPSPLGFTGQSICGTATLPISVVNMKTYYTALTGPSCSPGNIVGVTATLVSASSNEVVETASYEYDHNRITTGTASPVTNINHTASSYMLPPAVPSTLIPDIASVANAEFNTQMGVELAFLVGFAALAFLI